MRWLDGITDLRNVSVSELSWWWTGRPGVLWFMGSQRVRHDWATEPNWTEKGYKTHDRLIVGRVWGFPVGLVVKNPPANAGDVGSIPGLRRPHREGNGNPLQYSCLENPMDRGAWWATVSGVAKSDMTEQLSLSLFKVLWHHFWASLEVQLVKNLPAMWETWVGKIPWRRERLPTPVFWPREFHRLCSPWGHKESGMTERLSRHNTASGEKLTLVQGSQKQSKPRGNWGRVCCLYVNATENYPSEQQKSSTLWIPIFNSGLAGSHTLWEGVVAKIILIIMFSCVSSVFKKTSKEVVFVCVCHYNYIFLQDKKSCITNASDWGCSSYDKHKKPPKCFKAKEWHDLMHSFKNNNNF